MEEENKSWKSIMLLNDVTTQGQTVNLGQGVYQVKLFNLETIDPLDYIRDCL